jgi:hypothetical protein
LFLDSNQFDGDIFGRDTDNLPDFLIAHVFQPKQDDGSINQTQFVDALVELLNLLSVIVGVGKQVDVHVKGHCLYTAFLFALESEAGVETDTPNPSLHIAFALEAIEAPP